jgi:uncharacterized membrane protein YoaK (UPF0700 family)
MFRLGHGALYRRDNIVKWGILAFQGGSINAIGLLAGHRYVSHVTGFATSAAVEFSEGKWWNSISMLSVPCFFLLGAIISGFFIDLRVLRRRRPGYEIVLFMIFAILLFAFAGSVLGFFGKFGNDFDLDDHYSLLVLLSLSCGLQNAVITTASGSIIRTTHLTGITTDLGVGITRLFFSFRGGHPNLEELHREQAAFWMRLGIITSFILGSFATATLVLRFEYYGLALPTGTALLLWIIVKVQNRYHQPTEG